MIRSIREVTPIIPLTSYNVRFDFFAHSNESKVQFQNSSQKKKKYEYGYLKSLEYFTCQIRISFKHWAVSAELWSNEN